MREKILSPNLGAIKIVGLYLVIGFLWILFSDQLVDLLVTNKDMYHVVSIYKGWGYVLVTGILLYVLIKNHVSQIIASETWLRMAYDATDMGTWQYDISSGMVRFDNRARAQYGFGEDEYEVPLTDILARMHPEDALLFKESITNATTNPLANKYFSTEFRIYHQDSRLHWLGVDAHVKVERIRRKHKPVLIVGTSRDISDRMAYDERLRESEQRFRQLVDNIEEVFWIFDPVEKKEVYISPAFEKIWMRPVRYFFEVPERFFECILPEDRSYVRDVTSRQARGEKTEMKYRIMRPDGSIRWIWDRGFPVFDESGKITHVVAVVSDISEQKKAEIDLLELNQNLEKRVFERTAEVMDLYENAPAGYHSLDANGIIVRMNQTELNWLGYTREEIIGVKYITDLYTPESKKIFYETFPRHKTLGWVKDLELEVIRKDGSIMPVLLNATAIYNEQGEFVMSRSTFFDITERKRAELQLQAANLELEKAAKLKDDFLANMSHELRTPLNAIIGLSESLQIGTYGEIVPRQESILSVIRESGQHLLELINDILDLSKIEAGMLELQYEPVGLNSICEASLLMVKETARKKELRISTSITDQIQTITADTRRLKQMIVNLLSNAVKFTPQNGSIRLEVTPENDHAIRFTVQDTGIGISAEQLENLFKPFVQVDSSLARKFEGTGLGLALVRQLAEMHNGSIGVESVPGEGSSFYFIIPQRPLQGFKEDESPISNEILLEEDHITPSSFTILLVEDNPNNLMFTGDYLITKGFNMVTAENGVQALEQAKLYAPDLILMDIQMPEMDGLETIRRLRSMPQFVTVPIIALTALAMPGDREHCLEAGADEYLAKPVSLKKLFSIISNLLEAHGHRSDQTDH